MKSASLFFLLLLAAPSFAADPVYSWVKRADELDRIYLYRDGKQIGGWDHQAKHYRSLEVDTWRPPTSAAPVTPPTRVTQIQLNITPVQRAGSCRLDELRSRSWTLCRSRSPSWPAGHGQARDGRGQDLAQKCSALPGVKK